MLLGLLVCATNERNKADKFFELCQINLDERISHQDGEFVEYFPKIVEIAYTIMITHHNHANPENQATKKWVKSEEVMGPIVAEIFEEFTDKLFEDEGNVVNTLENEKFVDRIYKKFMDYLLAHKLRNIVQDKIAAQIK
jgi:hypothetical protein